ncbi:BTAD domain-containing putative transcriptional regulator [Nonomuraea sp. NPDC049750]|uniref:BTAD domain-containing putative transcriptional regulator n=1 Tax=Nonomuraea sp. NPDC049750 TaxID=3154738 RepID=UPI0034101308
MRVGILGSLVLETATGPTPVGGARLRALLARLVLDAGRAVRPATLIDGLWGETASADHLHALQSLVSRLRRVLGDPGLLTSGPDGYRLAVETDAVDAARFERLARAGRRSHAQARPAEAAAILREALSLWRGPALADVREAPFAAAEAERLERGRLAALEDRIEADLALGTGLDLAVDLAPGTGLDLTGEFAPGTDFDLVAELESLTAAHPLRERLHAQLIRALALNGRGAEALVAYQRIRDLLADSFGGDPGPHLQEAHLAVLRGDLPRSRQPHGNQPHQSHDNRPHRSHGSRTRRSHGNLDVPLTSFVGRHDEIRRVVDLLGRTRLVTLVGPGGAGKTRLANTIGRQLTPSGGVWFVSLAPVGADDVPRVLLDLLRVREENVPPRPVTPEAVLDQLVETVAEDDLVLVLDNCEHVVEAAATLAGTLLGRCPRLRVLATGREPLRIDGETLHPVLPPCPRNGTTCRRRSAGRSSPATPTWRYGSASRCAGSGSCGTSRRSRWTSSARCSRSAARPSRRHARWSSSRTRSPPLRPSAGRTRRQRPSTGSGRRWSASPPAPTPSWRWPGWRSP